MNRVTKQLSKGFTLIELMLAMTFISVLLLAIAMTVIQIGNIYNKGIVLKEVNQSSRSIADDLVRTATQSPQLALATDLRTNSAGGRLCFGSYSYIWNTADALQTIDPNRATYEGNTRAVRLVKVPDNSKIYCALNSTGGFTYRSIRAVDVAKSQELLPSGDHDLNVTQFTILPTATVLEGTTNQTLNTLMYTIASGKVTAMNTSRSGCLPPSDPASDLTYCTVQPFTIVLKSGGE